MKKLIYLFTLSCFLLFSCGSERKQGDLLEIPVDIEQDFSLALSEIAEEIVTIELELTNESLVNPDQIYRVLLSENYLIIAQLNRVLAFNKDGKFIRSIGSRGQGPGEYNHIWSLALDEKNKRLIILNSMPWKIICYDLDGKFLTEAVNPVRRYTTHALLDDINYIDDEFLIAVDQQGQNDEQQFFNRSVVYRMNDNFQVTDSIIVRNIYMEDFGATSYSGKDFILKGNESVYLYYNNNIETLQPGESILANTILPDTLYRIEENQLVPELRLKFKNDGLGGSGKLFINLYSIFRSSRYVFSFYGDNRNRNRFQFLYDAKTGKGYNMQDGFTDDINQIEKRVRIRPFISDTEMFYYLHTPIDSDDLEEPNPTLYIGKLKK
jgi:hypothetical protein